MRIILGKPLHQKIRDTIQDHKNAGRDIDEVQLTKAEAAVMAEHLAKYTKLRDGTAATPDEVMRSLQTNQCQYYGVPLRIMADEEAGTAAGEA